MNSRLERSLLGIFVVAGGACVPPGNAPPYDAGATTTSEAPAVRPSRNVMTAAFEDDFERPNARTTATNAPKAAEAPHDGGTHDAHAPDAATHDGASHDGASTTPTADAASPEENDLGPDWTAVATNAWRIENGKLCVQNAHNHPVWLNRTLPVNARIEFDAIAYTSDGDLKAEVWGDGKSAAKGTSYNDATSYLTILGGWKNKLHVLARLDEHKSDRKVIQVDETADDERQRAVMKGQTYHFKIERTDGKTIRWFVDDVEYFSWTDPAPLVGDGHDHFGFNEWEAKVCFDNVKVTPL